MDELLFVASSNGILHGIERRTGIVRWTYNAAGDGGKPDFHGRALVTAGLIVIGSDDRRPEGIGYVYAFDRHSLSLRWKRRAANGVMTDVVGCGGTAYVVTLGDELLALDLDSGVVRWQFASGASNPHYFPNSTPVIVGDRVIFGGFDGTVRALSTRSGSVLWQRDLGAWISTSVAAIGDDLYVGDSLGRIHKLDAATGASRVWLTIDGNMGFRLLPAGRSLLVFANEDGVTTLKLIASTLGAVNWTRSAPGPGWTSFGAPYVWKDWVVVGRGTGDFVALRLADGRPEWQGKVTGQVAGIGGDEASLYLGTTGGALYAYPLPACAR